MFNDCNSRADFLKKVIEYENILPPNELISLYQRYSSSLPDIAERQLGLTVGLINNIEKKQRTFYRKSLSTNVNFYSSSSELVQTKKLLFCFCGIANRLMLPIPVFLQCLPEQEFDVLIFSDPSKKSFLNGVPEFSISVEELLSKTNQYIDFQKYRALISIGTSGGGSAALYYGIFGNMDKAISVCGKHRSMLVRNVSNSELLDFDGYEFDRMIKNCIAASKTKTALVYGEKFPRDIAGARSLKKNLPFSQLIAIKNLADHNAFKFLLENGKLKEFIQLILKI